MIRQSQDINLVHLMAERDQKEAEEGTNHERETRDVSLASPKNPNQPPKSKVCRKLDFTDEYEKEVSNLLSLSNEELEQHRKKGIEKWNFDFENEIPLEGNWQWERIPVAPPETKEVICVMEKQDQDNRAI